MLKASISREKECRKIVDPDATTVRAETVEGKDSTESTELTEPIEAANCKRVVDLVQAAFGEGKLVE